jgi:glycosyltransferase involved in cell wall biosynthesis
VKISVVTNAFNQGRFLAAAAESVLSQIGPEVEYVIIEPGSTDNTPAIIAALEIRYPGRFTVLRESDDGPADGLNKGFARCSGDWFVYLNADDAFLAGAFASAAAAIARHGDAGAVIGSGYLVDEGGRFIRRAISTPFSVRRFIYGGSFALQQSTFYRANAFRAVGGFNLTNHTSWDAEILFELEKAGFRRATVSGYWSLFRMQPHSITVSQKLADESARTHARYFRNVTGRDPGALDRAGKRLMWLWARVSRPAVTLARIMDQLAPRNHVFAEAQTPDWGDS